MLLRIGGAASPPRTLPHIYVPCYKPNACGFQPVSCHSVEAYAHSVSVHLGKNVRTPDHHTFCCILVRAEDPSVFISKTPNQQLLPDGPVTCTPFAGDAESLASRFHKRRYSTLIRHRGAPTTACWSAQRHGQVRGNRLLLRRISCVCTI